MTKKVYYFNIGFDLMLSGHTIDSYQKIINELGCTALIVAEPEDSVLINVNPSNDYFEYLDNMEFEYSDKILCDNYNEEYTAEVWGWDQHTKQLLSKKNVACDCPDYETIKEVNSKIFSNQLAKENNLPGGQIFENLDMLKKYIQKIKVFPQVIKPVFSSAGSGFIIKEDKVFSKKEEHALEILFEQQKTAVLVEHWKNRINDYSITFDLSKTGQVKNISQNKMIVSSRGTFLAILPDSTDKFFIRNHEKIETIINNVKKKLSVKNYFGPVGIDMYEYIDENGEKKNNYLAEINARKTMTYIAQKIKLKYSSIQKCMLLSLTKNSLCFDTYKEFLEKFKSIVFNKDTGEGVLFLLPLAYTKNDKSFHSSRNLLFIAGNSSERIDFFYTKYKELSKG